MVTLLKVEDLDVKAPRRVALPKMPKIAVWLAAFWLATLLFVAVFASWLPIAPFDQPNFDAARQGPSFSLHEPLGRDGLGQSILSRLIYGAQISLAVGFLSVAFGLVFGVTLGIVAGYFGGWIDTVIGVFTDTLLSIPPLVLLLALAVTLSPSLGNLVISLGLLGLPTFLRIARANTLSIAKREYVAASAILGAKRSRILLREILPNVITPPLAYSIEIVGVFIVAEASLSFLGLGIPPPRPSWGGMIAEGMSDMGRSVHIVAGPVVVLFLTVLALKIVGDRFRERLDVRERVL